MPQCDENERLFLDEFYLKYKQKLDYFETDDGFSTVFQRDFKADLSKLVMKDDEG